MEKITDYLIQSTTNEKGVVKVWEEDVCLPTYEVGNEEKNPMFLEKRVYQGSSGVVYPYPVIEKIHDEKVDKSYRALFIENKYIKVMILPELGGRIHMAYDKVKKRHFVYYNQVVKPALVGLTGPWISGGIEFNWPQHHRPSTFMACDYMIEEHEDGSKTVWCNEVERMFRTKGTQGFRIYPDKAYIEINVRVYNRTSIPQTFLWWANPAVVVNDQYKSVFPPDVHAVFDHGKRAVSNFPIATGEYYKQDYSQGVDISKYKNIPVPTSYMAIKSKFDFIGGYDDGQQGGLLHVANHHVSPGKKQWTWGNGDFGVAWDRNLTDEDGPYIELMTGVFTDNQPDFTWLQPYEEKSWTQYFMPYAEVGYVKNANKDIVFNVEIQNGEAEIIVYATGNEEGLQLELTDITNKIWFSEEADISPENTFRAQVLVGDLKQEELIFIVRDSDGKELMRYQAEKPDIKPVPSPAEAALEPKEIASIEQLFLTGHHLEQYRHATYNPIDYYQEALNREPGDIRCNNAMGLLLYRRGQFDKSIPYFERSIATQTKRNPNPYDGEAYYNLGCAYKMIGNLDAAYESLYKSTWNSAWKASAFYVLAQIDSIRHDWLRALEHIDLALISNWHNHKARQLKASILRKLGEKEAAEKFVNESLDIDRFNMGCCFEHYLIIGEPEILNEMNRIMRKWAHSYIEYALDFAASGLYIEASELLSQALKTEGEIYPMVYYTLGYFETMRGNEEEARSFYSLGAQLSPNKCFPNRIEEINILKDAVRLNNKDAYAYYYLGNLWYGFRQYAEAIEAWEKSENINNSFPTVLRNLSLAYYNKKNDKQKALTKLEQAFTLDKSDARVLMELDQLYKKLGRSPQQRLTFLENHLETANQRDDIYVERVTLYNQLGRYQEALDLINNRHFHPWEGGEGKVSNQYVFCRVELAKQAIRNSQFLRAIDLLTQTDTYPHNLGEGKLINCDENDVNYYKGLAYQGLGDEKNAKRYFMKATVGASEPVQAFFYNDQQPDKIFYQGLSWRELGCEEKARSRFNKLIDHGKKHLFDKCKIDFFAVSLPDLQIWDEDLNIRNQVHCNYVMALGYSGLGEEECARKYYSKVAELDVNKQVYQE